MQHAIRRLQLAVFIALLTLIARTDSLTCFRCSTGKCDTLDEEECAPATAAAAAPAADAAPAAPARFIERQDAAAPAADAAPAAPAGGAASFQCVTLTGKAKGAGDDMVFRGCSPDGSCSEFQALVDDGSVCTPCPDDKCNYGEHLKPTAFSLLVFIAVGCLALSHC